jgi:hypothetical protein
MTYLMTTFHVKQSYYPNVDKETIPVTDLFRGRHCPSQPADANEITQADGNIWKQHMHWKRISLCVPATLFPVYGP